MKHLRNILCCFFLLWLCLGAAAISENGENQSLPITLSVQTVLAPEGEGTSYVRYPLLTANDAAFAPAVEKINRTMEDKAHIPDYLRLLSSLTPGGTGLRMDCSIGLNIVSQQEEQSEIKDWVFSVLLSAEGKMLSGRPSQVYYPMTFDLRTGEEISFDQLFTNPQGAKTFIEEYLQEEVEPTLSTHLENSQLFPIPFDRFFLDSFGHVILVYENSALSFLSGTSGAVSLRFSQLEPWLDLSPDGVISHLPWYQHVLSLGREEASAACWSYLSCGSLVPSSRSQLAIGLPWAFIEENFHITSDSGFYPGGACYEVEEAEYRGALILTDEREETVTGIVSGQVDLYGLQTGKTTLDEAEDFLSRDPAARIEISEAAAELYHVCPGDALVYPFDGWNSAPLTLTLYADEAGIVQYLKLSQ